VQCQYPEKSGVRNIYGMSRLVTLGNLIIQDGLHGAMGGIEDAFG
jgi:hypothetical protein